MKILGIETSCDETAAAVVEAGKDNVSVLSNAVSSSLPFHSETGGIIPEVAAREQVKLIIPVIEKALKEGIHWKKNGIPDIDAIAITYGPGLIGSLLVGVETAKALSLAWEKPIVPVNHLLGHVYATFIREKSNVNPSTKLRTRSQKSNVFPAIALIVSGGHTDLLLMENHGKFKWLGGTRDDAAGEAYDKIGRLLGLPYPAGPTIEELAKKGDTKAFTFPRPMIGSKDFDFSFSGLKASVSRTVNSLKKLDDKVTADICASAQEAIIGVLVRKTLKAARKYKVKSILLGGGVAANQKLRDEFKSAIVDSQLSIDFFVPPKNLCTDNGAMIAATAFYNYKEVPWQKIMAKPELYFD